MKVKLIYPPRIRTEKNVPEVFIPPLGISILTSYLRKNNIQTTQDDLDIRLYHQQSNNKRIDLAPLTNKELVYSYLLEDKQDNGLLNAAEKILKLTDYKNFDLIGFSVMDNVEFSNISISLILSKLIKEKTGTKIVFGGNIHPFHKFQEIPHIDYVTLGDGREPMLQLCNIIDSKSKKKYENIQFYDKKEKVLKNYPPFVKSNYLEISKKFFTIPDFDDFPLDLYRQNNLNESDKPSKSLILPYIFGFGCLNSCIFCPESGMRYARFNTPSKVAQDIQYLSEKYKPKSFYFINNLINPTYKYADEICNQLLENKLNVKWSDCACFKNLDLKLLNKLKKSGAIRLVFGLETGSKKLLKYIQKGITLKQAETILKESHDLGIWNCVELIAGLPYETDEDIKQTLEFIKKNKFYVNEFKLNKFHLNYSELYSNPKKYGIELLPPEIKEKFSTNFFQLRFKESKGKGYNKKIEQIEKSFKIVNDHLRNNHITPLQLAEITYINLQKKQPEFIKNFYKSLHKEYVPNEGFQDAISRIELLKGLILTNPNNLTFWLELNKSINNFERIQLIGPMKKWMILISRKIIKSNSICNIFGNMLIKFELYEEAYLFLNNNIKNFSNNSKMIIALINCHLGLKEYDKAKEKIKLLAKNSVHKEEIYINIARVYWETEQPQNALKYYKKALKINKINPFALRGIGECYIKLKKYNPAIKLLEASLKESNKINWSRFDLGKIYFNKADYKKSVYFLKKELENSTDSVSKFHSLQYLIKNYNKLKNQKKSLKKSKN